jgi:hypothetical protein
VGGRVAVARIPSPHPLATRPWFRRLHERVLSAVSQLLFAIQSALQTRSEAVVLQGVPQPLDPRVAVFMTMNPGYAGETPSRGEGLGGCAHEARSRPSRTPPPLLLPLLPPALDLPWQGDPSCPTT